jgi:signal transduction histidine kinase
MSVLENRRGVTNLVGGKHKGIKVTIFATMIPTIAMFLFAVALVKYVEFSLNRDLGTIINADENATYFLKEIWSTGIGLLFFAFGGVGLINLWLAMQLTKRLVGPITPISRHIEALNNGDYSSRISLRKNDYLEDIEVSLNELSAKLENSESTSKKE